MAYVRPSSPGKPHDYESDLYIYAHVDGGLDCCACRLLGSTSIQVHHTDTAEQMADHVREHQAAGHAVPDFVVPSLLGTGPRWVDVTLGEMEANIRRRGFGYIATDDADAGADLRISLEQLVDLDRWLAGPPGAVT